MSILSLHNISKRYGAIQALSGVSFEVPPGSVFGILGPNGSGKTTLLGIVTDVLKADEGTYSLFDAPPAGRLRRQIGTLLETPNFYHYLTACQNLQVAAAIKQKPEQDISRVLEIAGLTARQHSRFKTYSLGMKQRLAIASALLGDPGVLILDEPTNGLDPAGIAEVRELVLRLAETGKTIILASHLLDEVEKVCSHVAILQKGKLLLSGPVNEVLAREDYVELSGPDNTVLEAVLARHPAFSHILSRNGHLQVVFSQPVDLAALNAYCAEQGVWLNHLHIRKQSLEKAFLQLTNN
ncbi:ABC transporter ATP-binding protein [Chitinophaga japonensis]|uniref:ABC-2 type transport system ATP-binding protein n=1 Tax=Chitinophaga japonensis TaxID=104662 RepID=A0A562TBC3_CHIJA|nr:ATP-binding cassette domain-containing protein [Chitinophaga japonensis]TWI90852.1 ABC-2 type transport system ATP-binding protein [Chitinophaga japonensis]